MAEVFTLDKQYLDEKREQMMKDIDYARYRVGDIWYEAPIQNTQILKDGRIEVVFVIDHKISGNITVTGVELCDHRRRRIGGRSVNITRQDATEGILYMCRFGLFQIVKSDNKTGAYDTL